jgi:hypothetical protein
MGYASTVTALVAAEANVNAMDTVRGVCLGLCSPACITLVRTSGGSGGKSGFLVGMLISPLPLHVDQNNFYTVIATIHCIDCAHVLLTPI